MRGLRKKWEFSQEKRKAEIADAEGFIGFCGGGCCGGGLLKNFYKVSCLLRYSQFVKNSSAEQRSVSKLIRSAGSIEVICSREYEMRPIIVQ